MKIKAKITLLFTLLVTALLLILNISIYYITSAEIKDSFRKRLKSRASSNAQIFDYSGDSSLAMLKRVDAGTLAALPQKSVAIYDTLGRLLYHFRTEDADSLIFTREEISRFAAAEEDYFTKGQRDGISLPYYGSNRDFVIFVSASNEDGRQRLTELKQVLVLSLLIGVAAILVTGYIFSAQLVRPISDITREVNTISSNNLSKRLKTGISKDELNQLAETFNELLDRLQDSFNIQRRFISNASHELSTPLTSISSQLQVTLHKERNGEEYRAVLQSIQEDVEQMRQLTKGLLEIARAGSQGSIELIELRADELLLKVIADVKRNNEQYEVLLELNELPEKEEQCLLFGNFDLLYSAIKNIIENGCKYSPDHTSIVKAVFADMQITIDVVNKGDIITEQEIEQIFQPFFRGQHAGDTKGFGLGLPLAKRIIGLHKGELKVRSDIQGTLFQIILPSLGQSRSQF